MSAELPQGLPELPPVPEGFDRWAYLGAGWSGYLELYAARAYGMPGWTICRNRQTDGDQDTHYAVALRAEPVQATAPAEDAPQCPQCHGLGGYPLCPTCKNKKPAAAGESPAPAPETPSAYGLRVTVLATQLAEAVSADERPEEGGFDLSAGMFGQAVSDWLRKTAHYIDEAERRAAAVTSERDKLRLACNNLTWLHLNRHNIKDDPDRFITFLEAAVQDIPPAQP